MDFQTGVANRYEATPIVVDGVLCDGHAEPRVAIDARTGRQIWHHHRLLPDQYVMMPPGSTLTGFALPKGNTGTLD